MRFGLAGTQALAVPGRRTGDMLTVPVIPVEFGGARYVVSTRGESDWVRNVRAAGRVELRRRSKSESLRATELPVEERGPVIAAYRSAVGREVQKYFTTLPEPSDHPVFRLEPE
jgi:deazaflavin-dependent oxidoreductase (nitroreductase family)